MGFVAGTAVLAVLLFLINAYIRVSPRNLATGFRRSMGFLLVGGAVTLASIGRLLPSLLCALGAWVLLFGTAPPWRRPDFGVGSAGGGSGGQCRTPPRGNTMSRAEALNVLGLQDNANEADIRSAHRRLIQQIHPDKGGTNYLAAKINEAKDVLLARK